MKKLLIIAILALAFKANANNKIENKIKQLETFLFQYKIREKKLEKAIDNANKVLKENKFQQLILENQIKQLKKYQ